MSAAIPPPAGAVASKERDALGRCCFLLHFAVMIFVVGGWTMLWPSALIFYLAFVPAVALQWQFNRNSCVLNNLESLMRTGTWRDAANEEEGAWLLTLARDVVGLRVRPAQMDAFIYLVLLVLWGLGLAHLLSL
ncbi:MAG TPA: hypothetical protein VG274_00240 [Rhizomicrobium sp.]|nr:hypothetical protein [Rhizomicrobium sp.]